MRGIVREIIGLLLSLAMLSTTSFWGWKGRGGYPGLAPLQGANFFRRSYRGLRYAGPRLFTRAPSGLSLFLLQMAKLQIPAGSSFAKERGFIPTWGSSARAALPLTSLNPLKSAASFRLKSLFLNEEKTFASQSAKERGFIPT